MTELIKKVREKAALEEQQQELLQEKERLDKEVFDLKIAAHNEQADVEAMEGFSLKGLFLQITNKKEDRLEQERLEARTAKAKYELAAARLANVDFRLEQIAQALPALAGCESALSAALSEKLGSAPCPEEEKLMLELRSALNTGMSLQESEKALRSALDTAQSWLGTQPTQVYAYADEIHQAAVELQTQFRTYTAQLESLLQTLEPLGYSLNIQPFQKLGPNYLRGLYTDVTNVNRLINIQLALVQIDRQWSALVPELDTRLRSARIAWMNALVQTAALSI